MIQAIEELRQAGVDYRIERHDNRKRVTAVASEVRCQWQSIYSFE
ncbi:MAG TPA: hypothetical protein VFV38_47045 [Ktedonobacteraceae bacterium]|nr:hypothetical protein [Ktedonobacteraceae bacterium]